MKRNCWNCGTEYDSGPSPHDEPLCPTCTGKRTAEEYDRLNPDVKCCFDVVCEVENLDRLIAARAAKPAQRTEAMEKVIKAARTFAGKMVESGPDNAAHLLAEHRRRRGM